MSGCGSGFEWFPGTPQALTIFTTTLPNAVIGTPYSQTLLATGGKTPYAWTLDSGTLPAGLSLSFAGVISGTPTTASTTQTFTVKLTDSASPNVTATKSLTITIPGTTAALAITTTSLANAAVGTAYSATVIASGGTTPYTWAVTSGVLPAGLTLNASTGVISGTPGAAAVTSAFTVKVTDTSTTPNSTTQALTITIPGTTPALAIITSSLSAAPTGIAYSRTLLTTGGTSPYGWSVSAGTLPTGLSLSSGTISGTPTADFTATAGTGTFNFTVQVNDSSTPQNTATQALSLSVPTVGRMYDTTRVVYAENISSFGVVASSTTNLTITFGNPDTVPHNLTVHVGAFDGVGARLSTDLTVTNDPTIGPIPPGTSPSQTRTVPEYYATALWRITSVAVAP
jgi:hypothetical protein